MDLFFIFLEIILWLHIVLGVTISRDPLLQKAYWSICTADTPKTLRIAAALGYVEVIIGVLWATNEKIKFENTGLANL